jgi:hypothetical protein
LAFSLLMFNCRANWSLFSCCYWLFLLLVFLCLHTWIFESSFIWGLLSLVFFLIFDLFYVDHGVGIVLRVLSSRCFFSFCGYLIMGLERRNINEGVLWFFKLSCWYLRERDCLWFLFIGNSILKKFCYQNWRKIPSFVLFWEWTLGDIFFTAKPHVD